MLALESSPGGPLGQPRLLRASLQLSTNIFHLSELEANLGFAFGSRPLVISNFNS